MKTEFRDYQRPMMEYLHRVPYAGLWAQMGAGKTLTSLAVARDLLYMGEINRVLVVAPKRPAQLVWGPEVRKWDYFRDLKAVQLATPDVEKRRARLRSKADVYIINYELLGWLKKELAGWWLWDMMIIDEATRIKSPSSVTGKFLNSGRQVCKRVVELTGTPAPNGYKDVWAPVRLLDGGVRLGTTFKEFSRTFFLDVEGRLVLRKGMEKEIKRRLADIVMSVKTADIMPIEEPTYREVAVSLSPDDALRYAELEAEAKTQLASLETITAVSAQALLGKCHQFANGAVYQADALGNPTKEWAPVHDAKLDALAEIAESTGGEPLLVSYWFRHDFERLRKRFPEARWFGQGEAADLALQDDWNAGKVPMLLGHPGSIGHGLNLADGGCTVVFFSQTWALEGYQQIIERVGPARQFQAGHPRPVTVYHIVTEGTVDEVMRARIEGKAALQDDLMAYFRKRAYAEAA